MFFDDPSTMPANDGMHNDGGMHDGAADAGMDANHDMGSEAPAGEEHAA